MSDETNLVVAQKAKASNNVLAMFDKVKGLSEDSPLRKMQSQGTLRLGVDGNVFQTKKGSKVVQRFMDPENKKKPTKELDVVIHMVSPVIQKQAAIKYDPRDPKFEPLGCWSNDGDNPDEAVWNKQSHKCDTCKFGKGQEVMDKKSGKMATCGLTRLAVVSLYSPTQEDPSDIELMLMNFNWSSNKAKNNKGQDPEENQYGLISYLEMLAGIEVETHRVVTRLSIDDWSDPKNNCKLLFQPVHTLSAGDPNFEAHKLWEADETKDLKKMCLIDQRKPADDAPEGDGGAPVVEEEDAAPVKKKVAKKRATKKTAAKKKPESVEEEIEEEIEDLEDILSDDLDEVEVDEVEEELVVEDDDDFGDLEDLLD